MIQAVLIGLLVAGLVYVLLMPVERWLHRTWHRSDRSYRWGVWVFALLAGVYAFITSLGR